MTEKQRKQIVYGVFLLVALWGLYMEPWKRSQPDAPSGTDQAAANAAPVVAASIVPVSTMPVEAAVPGAPGRWTRDPFGGVGVSQEPDAHRPPVSPSVVPILQGIMVVGKAPACVMGNRVMRAGDVIEGWRIDQITADSVVIVHVSDQKRLALRAGVAHGNRGQ